MTTKQKAERSLLFAVVITTIMCIFAAVFLLTSFIYQKFGFQPAPLLAHLINSLLGLFFCIVTMFSLSRFFHPETNVFAPIIEAMGQIAKGDFSVQLTNQFKKNELIGELTNSVNTMALELNKMEMMRQEFISNVSHEIQSPLTSIRGFAQALRNEHLSLEERTRYLLIIETESTRLSRITENLLKLASLETEQIKVEPKPYPLDRQIRDLILACEPQWTSKHIEMEVSLDALEYTADEDLLSQVWINLIANSVKFTPNGGTICVDLHRKGDRIEFIIADTGVGIAPVDQLHIFERFYKADKSRTRSNNSGSGLGLSIVRKIVDLHKGTIAVTSNPGSGTAFTVSLPV